MAEKNGFDGSKFINKVILLIFLLLLIFGSMNLGELTEVADID
ncbi:hypothetical protein MKY34_09670 [Sporosarcina sp. FSL K6-1522]